MRFTAVMWSGGASYRPFRAGMAPQQKIMRAAPLSLPAKCGAQNVERDVPASTSATEHAVKRDPPARGRRGGGTRSGRKGGVLTEEPAIEDLSPPQIATPETAHRATQETPDEAVVGEVELDSDDDSDISSPSMSEDEQVTEEVIRRKSAVILALLSATPATLEPLVREHAEEIDEVLLQILYRRLQVAKEFKEGEEVVEGLELLLARLCTEYERKISTPALRLLDDLLLLMGSDVGESEQARLNMATERMQKAFNPQRGSGVDIFAMAEALGSGQLDAADAEAVEFVLQQDFVEQVGQLIPEATTRISQIEMELEQMEVALREGILRGVYKGEEREQLEQLLSERREKAAEMSLSMKWADMLHKYANMMSETEEVF